MRKAMSSKYHNGGAYTKKDIFETVYQGWPDIFARRPQKTKEKIYWLDFLIFSQNEVN